jgi:hypothetical protein
MKVIKWLLNHPIVFITILLGISIVCIIYLLNSNARYKELYVKGLQNVMAYQAINSDLKNDIVEFQMSIKDLKASRDSIDRKILNEVKALKIKDKNITHIQYQTKEIFKTDTITLPDTIFIPEAKVDTSITDNWYSLNLKLNYPSSIIATPKFKSEQYVVTHNKKEYVNKRSKWFFIRWFQKKQWVTEIKVIEKSPYVINKESRFINIVK